MAVKKKATKAKPSILGSGGAYKAGKALEGRKSRLDALEAEITGSKKKKGTK